MKKLLTKEELEALPTKRLLAYQKKTRPILRRYINDIRGYDYDDNEDSLFFDSHLILIKEVLNAREHIIK